MKNKKSIKSIVGAILFSTLIVLASIYVIASASYTLYDLITRDYDTKDICVAEKVLINPETNKLELATIYGWPGTPSTLSIMYGKSCKEFEELRDNIYTPEAIIIPGVLGLSALGLIPVVMFIMFVVFVVERIRDWIESGDYR